MNLNNEKNSLDLNLQAPFSIPIQFFEFTINANNKKSSAAIDNDNPVISINKTC